jgi:adenylate cyclase
MEFHEINAFNKWTENLHMTAGMENRVVGYSRLAGERTLTRLRALRSDLIDPTISLHQGRVVKHTGDGVPVEFRSEVEVVLWLGGSAVREYAAIR